MRELCTVNTLLRAGMAPFLRAHPGIQQRACR
jgi:hypothetical protein